MNGSRLFLKAAAIASSLVLATGFVLYRTGDLDRLVGENSPIATALHAGVPAAHASAMLPDTFGVEAPLGLDSAQHAYLQKLRLIYPPPEGRTSHTTGGLLRLLDSVEEQPWILMSSSKSAPIVQPSDESSAAMAGSIRQALLASMLDSAQRAYLDGLMQQYPPPEGRTSHTFSGLLNVLDSAEERQRMLMYSSKSAPVIGRTNSPTAMIQSIRRALRSDAADRDESGVLISPQR